MKFSLDPSPEQFARDIAAVKRAMKGQLKDASAVAADWASESMRSRYNQLHSRVSGRAAASFRASGARLMFGSARVPYMLGQNFGSTRYQHFPALTVPDHFAFSTVRKGAATIQQMYDVAMTDAMEEAFRG